MILIILERLEVPGLAEKRPSVMLGDTIKLFPAGVNGAKSHVGYVHRVENRRVLLHLHASFNASVPYDVEFCLARSSASRTGHILRLLATCNWAT